jgi:hypothetical protein
LNALQSDSWEFLLAIDGGNSAGVSADALERSIDCSLLRAFPQVRFTNKPKLQNAEASRLLGRRSDAAQHRGETGDVNRRRSLTRFRAEYCLAELNSGSITSSGVSRREFIRWRWKHGLSLTAAAEALGLSRRTIAYYVSGEQEAPRIGVWRLGSESQIAPRLLKDFRNCFARSCGYPTPVPQGPPHSNSGNCYLFRHSMSAISTGI